MPKATIKSKSGTVITVEGTESEVSKIVSIIDGGGHGGGHAQHLTPKPRTLARVQRKRMAASDLVIELKEQGFFDKPKRLADISAALQEKGYVRPVTTLSGVMLGLVHKRLLARKKLDRRW